MAFRVAASTNGGNAQVSSIALTVPSGVQENDVLIAAVALRSSSITVTAPSGWTQIRRDSDSPAALSLTLFRRTAGTSEPGSYTFTLSGSVRVVGWCAAFSNINTAAPVQAEGTQSNSSGGTMTAPALTVIDTPADLLFIGVANNSRTCTPPTGMDERADLATTNGGSDVTLTLATEVVSGAGSTGTRTGTLSQPASSIGTMLALDPASATTNGAVSTSITLSVVEADGVSFPAGTGSTTARVRLSVSATGTANSWGVLGNPFSDLEDTSEIRNQNRLTAYGPVRMVEAGTLRSAHLFVRGGPTLAQNFRVAVYTNSESNGTDNASTLVAVSGEATALIDQAAGWLSMTIPAISLPAGDYWLCPWYGPAAGNAGAYLVCDSGLSTAQHRNITYSSTSDPPTFGVPTSLDSRWAKCYVTYSVDTLPAPGSGLIAITPSRLSATAPIANDMSGPHTWQGENYAPLVSYTAYRRYTWSQLEGNQGEYSGMDVIEQDLQAAAAQGQRFSIRVRMMTNYNSGQTFVPSYLTPYGWYTTATNTFVPDWNNAFLQTRYAALIAEVARRFNGRLAFADVGAALQYGEWDDDLPYDTDPNAAGFVRITTASRRFYVDLMVQRFADTPLVMHLNDAEALAYTLENFPRIGIRADSIGNGFASLQFWGNRTPQERYRIYRMARTAPIVAESVGLVATVYWQLSRKQAYRSRMHTYANGNFSGTYSGQSATTQAAVLDMYTRQAGWRFALARLDVPSVITGQQQTWRAWWLNENPSAPFDNDWQAVYRLRNPSTQAVVWSGTSTLSFRDTIGIGPRVRPVEHIDTFAPNVPNGTYNLELAVISRNTLIVAPMFLANAGRQGDGSYLLGPATATSGTAYVQGAATQAIVFAATASAAITATSTVTAAVALTVSATATVSTSVLAASVLINVRLTVTATGQALSPVGNGVLNNVRFTLTATGNAVIGPHCYQDVGGLTPGATYTISAKGRSAAGSVLILRVTDGFGTANPAVGTVTGTAQWQLLSTTRTAPSSGSLRVYLEAQWGGTGDFDDVLINPGSVADSFYLNSADGAVGGGAYRYTVLRNLDGSGANDWFSGDAVFNTGQAGNGFIDLYSLAGVTGSPIHYIFNHDATTGRFSENYTIANTFEIFGDGVRSAAGNAAYFGSTGGVWQHIYAYLQSPLAGGLGTTWEYWNGSAWAAFTPTFTPAAGFAFNATGPNAVEWNTASLPNWAATTINGEGAYWVRCRVTVPNNGSTGPITSRRTFYRKRAYGPTIAMNVRNSLTYNDWSEHSAIGNLNGLYDYGNDVFGVAVGRYATGSSWLSADSVNGIRIMRGSVRLAQWNQAGVITIGQVAPSQSNLEISSGLLRLRVNTTEYVRIEQSGIIIIDPTAGSQVAIGTPADSPFVGSEIQLISQGVRRLRITNQGDIYQGTNTYDFSTIGLVVVGQANATIGEGQEAMTAGDLMLGRNHPLTANLLWDASDGTIRLRRGTSNRAVFRGDGTFEIRGDVNNYISWNGSVLTVSGAINIIAGNAATIGYADAVGSNANAYTNAYAPNRDLSNTNVNWAAGDNRGGNAINTNNVGSQSAGTVNNGVDRAQAGLDGSGNVRRVLYGGFLPSANPVGAGLNLTSQFLGYHDGNQWRTYMDNAGRFTFVGQGGARLVWDGQRLEGRNSSNTVQWYTDAATGDIVSGGGALRLTADGLRFDSTFFIPIQFYHPVNIPRPSQIFASDGLMSLLVRSDLAGSPPEAMIQLSSQIGRLLFHTAHTTGGNNFFFTSDGAIQLQQAIPPTGTEPALPPSIHVNLYARDVGGALHLTARFPNGARAGFTQNARLALAAANAADNTAATAGTVANYLIVEVNGQTRKIALLNI